MILQYRTLDRIPEVGALPGDILVVDAEMATVELVRALDDTAMALMATLIPILEPVSASLPPHAAAALVSALAPRQHTGSVRPARLGARLQLVTEV